MSGRGWNETAPCIGRWDERHRASDDGREKRRDLMENRKKGRVFQRKGNRRKKIRILTAAVVLTVGIGISGLAFAGIRGMVKAVSRSGPAGGPGGQTFGKIVSESEQAAEIKEPEAVFPAGTRAGHVDLTGLTSEEAKTRLEESFRWNLQVADGENTVLVPDFLADWLGAVTGSLEGAGMPEAGQLQPDYGAVRVKLQAFAVELAAQWDRQPVNSQAESYDKVSGVYTYSQGTRGRSLNQEALVDRLQKMVESGDLDAVIKAEFTERDPKRTKEAAKEQYRVIGTFSTKTTDNKNRNQNIRLAAESIDGTVLKPGQEFSFNTATGNRTSEKGYQPAGAYKNGVLIEEPGGGVCQVSTTLYHAIINSGFRTTERNAHSFAPSYVEKGQDAMVSFDGYAGPDLKFVNSGQASVVLRASFSGRDLKMSVVGLPILGEGVEVTIRSEKVRDVEPGTAVYRENTALAYGTEKTVEAPAAGSVWKSYRVLKKNGEVTEEQPLHNSSYRAKNGMIERNTTVQTPAESQADNQADAAGQAAADGQADAAGQTAGGGENLPGAAGQAGIETQGAQNQEIPQPETAAPSGGGGNQTEIAAPSGGAVAQPVPAGPGGQGI